MANELDQFEQLDTGTEVATPSVVDKGTNDKKTVASLYKEAMKETLEENPDYIKVRRSMTDTVKVVNTLGFSATGGVIKAADSTPEKRKLTPVGKIVGYKIQNIGNEPLPYDTEEYVANEEGKFVWQRVSKTLAPGETTVLSRKYATILFSRPEFNLRVENGKFISPRRTAGDVDVDAVLSGHYFSFNSRDIKVNDDSVKIQIGEEVQSASGATKWVVKPEYQDTFGYLNNKGSKRGKGRKSGPKLDAQDYAANYLRKLIEGQM